MDSKKYSKGQKLVIAFKSFVRCFFPIGLKVLLLYASQSQISSVLVENDPLKGLIKFRDSLIFSLCSCVPQILDILTCDAYISKFRKLSIIALIAIPNIFFLSFNVEIKIIVLILHIKVAVAICIFCVFIQHSQDKEFIQYQLTVINYILNISSIFYGFFIFHSVYQSAMLIPYYITFGVEGFIYLYLLFSVIFNQIIWSNKRFTRSKIQCITYTFATCFLGSCQLLLFHVFYHFLDGDHLDNYLMCSSYSHSVVLLFLWFAQGLEVQRYQIS